MKAIHILNIVVGIIAFGLLEQSNALTFELAEELAWLLLAIGLFNYLYSFLRLRFLSYGFLLFILGLYFDFVEDLPAIEIYILDWIDTLLKNGGFLVISLSLFRVIQEKKKFIEQLRFEIKQKSKLQKKLEHAAYHDELTALPNRKALFERLEAQRTKPITVLYFDLDNFKAANDKHGHEVGDKLLVRFSHNLQQKFGEKSAYRLGGDEFIVLFDQAINKEEVLALRRELSTGLTEYYVGVSLGFYELQPLDTPDHGLHQADLMMYQDKANREEQEIQHFPAKYRNISREDPS